MLIKYGTDIIKDSRLQKHLEDSAFLNKVFHLSEQKHKDIKKLASIFVLKESVSKALLLTPPKWLSVEISYDSSGKPTLHLSDDIMPSNLVSYDSSVSHEDGYTIGSVTLLLKK